MVNLKYLLYIDGQSSKLLVNSIFEAKRCAEIYFEYKQPLRIECFCSPTTICEWNYNYITNAWIKNESHNTGTCRYSSLCQNEAIP